MIQDQINAIGEALEWIKAHKPEQYDQRFTQLVKERLALRKLDNAKRENPAIAAYGESQKGKSHVMNELLLKDGQPFYVTAADKNGNERNYDFLDEINPPTIGNEATGIVTRFTAFEQPDKTISPRYRKDHPVLLKLLSPSDMAIILFDSYCFDTDNQRPLNTIDEINAFALALKEKYESYPVQPVTPIIEDDIYEIAEYAEHHIGTLADRFYTSNYFHILARIVRQIPLEELPYALKVLWHSTPEITNLYDRLLKAHQRLGFASEVYTNIDSVLNRQNTIMAVVCLKGLNNKDWLELKNDEERFTTVYMIDEHKTEHVIERFPKCELAAIAAEVVFKIDASALECAIKYNWDTIPAESRKFISGQPFSKDILHSNDLLDFPGARPREDFPVNALMIDVMVKRGKVAYLFHKYSDNHVINMLLFCHDQENVQCTDMYKLVANWVQKFVGKTPDERARNVARMNGVPPIFVICTKFNMDLKHEVTENLNDSVMLTQRWDNRFQKVLYKESLKPDIPDNSNGGDLWFMNFTAKGRRFDNCYLLRDFKYSSAAAGGNLYTGYDPKNPLSSEQTRLNPAEFWDRLRETFISNDHAKFFFSNPELAWDVATTMNNDGAQYLIERLMVVAPRLSVARHEQLQDKQREICHKVSEILSAYYESEDADEKLRKNIRKAKKVTRELDFCIQHDNYYFGHMIERFQVTERDTYTVLHKLIQGTELNQKTTDFGGTSIILKRYGKQLALCQNDNERWELLQEELVLDSRQEVEEYLQRKGIDPTSIFSPNQKKHQNSVIIADKTFDAWIAKLRSPLLLEALTEEEEFDSIIMSQLIENIAETAEQMKLSDKIASSIAEFVNVLVTSTINETLVADLMATEINNFVNDLGFSYRDADEIDGLRKIAKEFNLSCFEHIDVPRQETYTDEELTKMFDDFNENESTLTPSFALNYWQWVEYMTISFIGKGGAFNNYDRQANHLMGEIIKKIG